MGEEVEEGTIKALGCGFASALSASPCSACVDCSSSSSSSCTCASSSSSCKVCICSNRCHRATRSCTCASSDASLLASGLTGELEETSLGEAMPDALDGSGEGEDSIDMAAIVGEVEVSVFL